MWCSSKTFLFLAPFVSSTAFVEATSTSCQKNGVVQDTANLVCDSANPCTTLEQCDSVTCKQGGCQGATFTNVKSIVCDEDNACESATFQTADNVRCDETAACKGASFVNVKNADCLQWIDACQGASFESCENVLCTGFTGCFGCRFESVSNVVCQGPGLATCALSTFNNCNSVNCLYGWACQDARMTDCDTVTCSAATAPEGDACSGSTISSAKQVKCSGKQSCSRAEIDAVNVVCDTSGGGIGCLESKITASDTLLCNGNGDTACDANVVDAKSIFCAQGGCASISGYPILTTPCLICEGGQTSCNEFIELNGTYLKDMPEFDSTKISYGDCEGCICKFCTLVPESDIDFDSNGEPDCKDNDGNGDIDSCESGLACVKGDPHITLWNKETFDFHGECDLVMLHSDHVNDDKAFDLHIRTLLTGSFSSIESAALKVGNELMEMDAHRFYYNAKELHDNDLPLVTSEFTVTGPIYTPGFRVRRDYNITLNDNSAIVVRKTKSYLSVSIKGHHHDFEDSQGLLGDFFTGRPLGRNGLIIKDWVEYGMEWQVLPNEPKLFRQDRPPQLPYARCNLPTQATMAKARRLGSNHAGLVQMAQAACVHAGHDMENCMSDVILTGDASAAEAF